jgi:hypothetical protein
MERLIRVLIRIESYRVNFQIECQAKKVQPSHIRGSIGQLRLEPHCHANMAPLTLMVSDKAYDSQPLGFVRLS